MLPEAGERPSTALDEIWLVRQNTQKSVQLLISEHIPMPHSANGRRESQPVAAQTVEKQRHGHIQTPTLPTSMDKQKPMAAEHRAKQTCVLVDCHQPA